MDLVAPWAAIASQEGAALHIGKVPGIPTISDIITNQRYCTPTPSTG